jgi:hypothetical protein
VRFLGSMVRLLVGARCEWHRIRFRSDCCPRCNRTRFERLETKEVVRGVGPALRALRRPPRSSRAVPSSREVN